MRFSTLIAALFRFQSFVFESDELVKDSSGCPMRVVIHVRARKNSRIHCSRCGAAGTHYDTLPPRDTKFEPYCGIPVVFRYSMRRCLCPKCGKVVVEKVPWCEGKSPVSQPLKVVVTQEAKKNAIIDVAKRYDLSWNEIHGILEDAVDFGLKVRDLKDVRVIGVDEIAWQSGHRYITLVYDLKSANGSKRLLWVGKDRTKETLQAFFDDMEKRCPGFASALEVACTDMWKPYMDVIAQRVPNAMNVLDRFHVMRMLNQALDAIRNEEFKRLGGEDGKVLVGTKYCFLKNPENLTFGQALRIQELKKMNLRTVTAYMLKEQLRVLWGQRLAPEEAEQTLGAWIAAVMRSGLEPLKRVARTLRSKMKIILNFFRAKFPVSSGCVEGMNRLVNLAIRKAFGFRSFSSIKTYLLNQLGNLEPLPLLHKFC